MVLFQVAAVIQAAVKAVEQVEAVLTIIRLTQQLVFPIQVILFLLEQSPVVNQPHYPKYWLFLNKIPGLAFVKQPSILS